MTIETKFTATFSKLGFSDLIIVSGRLSIADLFPKSRKRCGIYLLGLSDNLFYIGQAVDVVRRFAQHLKNYDDLCLFSFQPIPEQSLNTTERGLIQEAEQLGVPLVNRVHVSNIIGETDLDFIMPVSEQEEWLQNNDTVDDTAIRVRAYVDDVARQRYKHKFQRFQSLSEASSISSLYQTYVHFCVPAFRRTEFSFWSLSCLPDTNKSTWPRYACLSINSMETFVIGHVKQQPQNIWAFINVAEAPVAETYGDADSFYKAHPNTSLERTAYRAGGGDQLHIEITSFAQAQHLLKDPTIINAAKLLNLRLMRKGGTIYSRFHSFALADLVVN